MSIRSNDLKEIGASPLPPMGSSLRVAWRLLRFAVPYWRGLLVILAAIIGTGVFAIALPQLLIWAIDSGLGVDVVDGITTVDVDESLLLVAALALLGAALMRGLFQFVQSYLGESVAQAVAYDLRTKLYDRLQSLSFAYHDDAETGQIMSRATQDVEAVRLFINLGGVRLLFTALFLTAIVAIMFVISWILALAVWAFMIVIAVRSIIIARQLRPVWLNVQDGQAQLGTVLQEALTGIRVVKAFAREEHEGRKFRRRAEFLFRHSYRASIIQAINTPLMTALWMGSLVATIWIGGVQVSNGSMSLGELTGFLIYIQLLQMPVRSLGFMVTMVPRAAAAGARIFEILDQESDVQERPGAMPPQDPQGHVRFEGVSFAYDPRAPVLERIDLDARPGEIVALLGPTGSGKSTIVNLLPRFYDVTAGQVTLDGVDVRDLTLDGLRSQVAIVQQDVFLFSDTLRRNIAYGRPSATEEEIQAAGKVARIHDFIMSQPDGYDTWVGERGATLSGGQKQRIAIARALLMDPRVLIFDDSTSSVDTETEFEIQQALSALMQGRTTFIIAHRLRSVREADTILVLDQGRIVERGQHDGLLAKGGLYREIYDLEMRDIEEAYAPAVGGPA